MTRPSAARTGIAQTGHARAVEVRLEFAKAVREARRDAGLSARGLALAADVSTDTVIDIEEGTRDHGMEVVARVAAALGGRLRFWFEPGTGAAVHDRIQAAMVGALLRLLHASWSATAEVSVTIPVRGVIDLVLDRAQPSAVVAAESESTLNRLEQQIRWASAKADALSEARTDGGVVVPVSRLLLLRSTQTTRAAVATFPDVVQVAYPARIVDALAALTGTAPWPGPALLWCDVTKSDATVLDHPPRGIRVGR